MDVVVGITWNGGIDHPLRLWHIDAAAGDVRGNEDLNITRERNSFMALMREFCPLLLCTARMPIIKRALERICTGFLLLLCAA